MNERKPHPHRAGTFDWIVFLVTVPEEKLLAFCNEYVVEIFDRRAQTLRCRAHGEDRGLACYERACTLAKKHDLTLQDLVDTGRRVNEQKIDLGKSASVVTSDHVEEYPVVVLGSHGMKWPPEKEN